jgi:hypothetical protein
MGVDALQALLLAIEGIRIALDRTGSRFEWLGPGLTAEIPRQLPTCLGKRFERRLNEVIERETVRHWASYRKTRNASIAEFEAELEQRRKTVASWEAVLKKRKELRAAGDAVFESSEKARTDKTLKKT